MSEPVVPGDVSAASVAALVTEDRAPGRARLNPFVRTSEEFFAGGDRGRQLEELLHLSRWSRRLLAVTALGVTLEGEKVVLGVIQAGTENETVIKAFLTDLLGRGLNMDGGILCVIDGAKGLRSAIRKVFADKALVQRCQWHKRENVVEYLPKSHQSSWRRRLQQAYEKPTYEEAKAALDRLKPELKLLNVSALASLEEGLEETLTLHRLGLFADLGISFKTTNCIESVMALVGQYTDKVDCWRNSSQKHRWVGSALLEIEHSLRRVKGYRKLWKLREALQRHTGVLREAA